MTINEIPGVARLSTPERILLVEDLWDSIALEEEGVPVPTSHLDELEIRLKNISLIQAVFCLLRSFKQR